MKFLILLLALYSPGDLKIHVEQLTISSRYTGSPGLDRAQQYVVAECQSYGLKVREQGMMFRGKECHNIIAWREGVDKDKIIVIGAHLDSTKTPGADDNASGSACVLQLAEKFAKDGKPKCTVVFQWYTGEEQGLVGSRFYTKNPLFPVDDPDIKKHVFMLNLDMVGRLKVIAPGDDPVQNAMDVLFPKYPFAKDITFQDGRSNSDHASFREAGVPAVFLHTGLHDDYHQSTDVSDRLNYDGMDAICDYAFDFVIKVMGGKIPNYVLWELPERGNYEDK